MLKRLTFRCWNCAREYAMTREIDGEPQILVACPFCGQEGVVDLGPYRDRTTVVYRGEEGKGAQAASSYTFPPVIPTVARGGVTR